MQDCDTRPRQTHLSSYAVHFPDCVEHGRNDIQPSNGNASPKQDELTAYVVLFGADAMKLIFSSDVLTPGLENTFNDICTRSVTRWVGVSNKLVSHQLPLRWATCTCQHAGRELQLQALAVWPALAE